MSLLLLTGRKMSPLRRSMAVCRVVDALGPDYEFTASKRFPMTALVQRVGAENRGEMTLSGEELRRWSGCKEGQPEACRLISFTHLLT